MNEFLGVLAVVLVAVLIAFAITVPVDISHEHRTEACRDAGGVYVWVRNAPDICVARSATINPN